MNSRVSSVLITILLCSFASDDLVAAEVTRDAIGQWLGQASYADPPVAGSVVGFDDLDSLAPWIAPGYIDELRFPGVAVEIQSSQRYQPHASYAAATERFAGQVTLGEDGSLQNYEAGRPFSDDQIAAAKPGRAGFMIAWNHIHRWQFYGYQLDEVTMAYVSPGSGAGPLDTDKGLDGGGQIGRFLSQTYHRVYLNKVAMLPDQDYQVDVPDSDTRFFKDFLEFLDPFNVKGTKFVIERMLDPHADDQVNTYLPTERRVRRFSARERADSFMGSNATLDDFDGFSGRVLDYTWHYLGDKRILDVTDTKHDVVRFFGPHSRVPNDRWQLRDCRVVEVFSVWDGHPYRSRVLFIDKETYDINLSLVFSHDNMLWKSVDPVYKAAEPDGSIETSVTSWRGQSYIDYADNTATVVRGTSETLHPKMKPSQIKRIFSVSSLTSGQ